MDSSTAAGKRLLFLAALALLTALAWLYLFHLSARMAMLDSAGMPDMPGMASAILTPGAQPWTVADFALAWVMWAVMMVAMMTPSATPMLLLHAGVGRDAARRGQRWSATAWFAAGYFLAWSSFSLAAAAVQAGLQQAAWLTPMLAPARPAFAATVLIAAGLYQFTPFKSACLSHCRSPLHFIQQHGGFRPNPGGSLALGLRHGWYCIGCCWALMALLFAVGVMNLAWVAALAVIVLLEKTLSSGPLLARLAGLGLIAFGGFTLLRP
ncbi:MAG: DUF2182 domain-containing protein [Terriglobales bacterium]